MEGRTIKLSFRSFVKKGPMWNILQTQVENVNRIVVEAYHLLNLHILRILTVGRKEIPPFNQQYVLQFIRRVSVTSNQGRPTETVDSDIEETYRKLYAPLRVGRRKRSKLFGILQKTATEMSTVIINNNIISHFFKRQYQHLRLRYPKLSKEELYKLQEKVNSNPRRCETHPSLEVSMAYDLQAHPERFLKSMLRMNRLRRERKKKLFSLLSLRRGFVPSNIRITNTGLEELSRGLEEAKKYFEQKASRKKESTEVAVEENKHEKGKGNESTVQTEKDQSKITTKKSEEKKTIDYGTHFSTCTK